MILRHRMRSSEDLTFNCILQDGLSFTAPLYAPSMRNARCRFRNRVSMPG